MENSTTKEVTVTGNAKAAAPVKVGNVTADGGKNFDIFRHTINRGQGIGNTYFGPDFEAMANKPVKELIDDLVALHGEDSIKDIFIRAYRPICNDISKEAVSEAEDEGKDKDENAILEIFKTSFKDLAVESKSKADLEEEQQTVMGDMTKTAKQVGSNPSLMPKFLELAAKAEKLGKAIAKKARNREPKPKNTPEATTGTATPNPTSGVASAPLAGTPK